jgi:phosphoribosylformylglycinamidine synthase
LFYVQYDNKVGASPARVCSDSVGVIRLKSSKRGLGVVLGCRPHIMRFDARIGGMDAIAYPALELALKGFEPLAVTDCLNFGNPERENIMSEFVASLDGMNQICRGLEAPIISGNVSFYNETMGRNITSTPATGLVGLRDSVTTMPEDSFTRPSLHIYVLRLPGLVTGGAWQEGATGRITGRGDLDPQSVCGFIGAARALSQASGVEATRAVGKFGLGYALARMSHEHGVGARVEHEGLKLIRSEADMASLFEEHLYEAIFAVDPVQAVTFEDEFSRIRKRAPTAELHRVGRTQIGKLEIASFIESDVVSLEEAYRTGWAKNGL